MNLKRKNVAFLPYVVAGHPIGLAQAVANRDFNIRFWTLEKTKFKYGDWDSVFDERDKYLTREIKRIIALIQVVFWADVVHCTFGSTLAGHLDVTKKFALAKVGTKNWLIYNIWRLFYLTELKIYRITRKKLVMDFQGDDIRQANYQLKNFDYSLAQVVDEDYYEQYSDEHKRWKLQQLIKSGFSFNAITPDLLNYLPPETVYLPESNVEIPKQLEARKIKKTDAFQIVHAPSNRKVKGTQFLIKAVEELQNEGYNVELNMVEGVENSEVLEMYSRAHIAVDQLRIGWYGRFAVECMSVGTPVICYIREEDLKLVSTEMAQELPILNATEKNLTEVIRSSIELNSNQYEKLRKRTFDYVAKWHNAERIAQSIIPMYLKK